MPEFIHISKTPDAVIQLRNTLLTKYYKDLCDAKARIDVIMVYADLDKKTHEIKGPALVLHGTPANGIASVTSKKDRARGCGDGLILLDGDHWDREEMTDAERAALLDHELYHFEVERDDADRVKLDNGGRPVLTMRPHDYDMGWFVTVVRRHGDASPERIQAKGLLADEAGQILFPEIVKP